MNILEEFVYRLYDTKFLLIINQGFDTKLFQVDNF
jgi:hypothetical protein